jgi:hypothetical protein
MKKYDYIIVGSGPTGITIAWILSKQGKCLLIDKEQNIGGCHRVTRVNGYFTEHGPRVYSDAYKNFITILEEMGLNFHDLFTPYNFNMSEISGGVFKNIELNELNVLGLYFFRFIFCTKFSKSITVEQFMLNNNFSENTIDYFDRLCRLSDGAGADVYTLYELFQMFNQHFFYKLYQPKQPTDIGLFKKIKEKLEENNVDILLQTELVKLEYNNSITNIIIKKDNVYLNIYAKNFILAIPVTSLLKILNNSKINDAFGNYNDLISWNNRNKYKTYIPIVFHWNTKLELDKIWGFTKTEFGLVYIVLSDYMKFNESQTVISCCFTKVDDKIHNLDLDQLLTEAFKQLKLTYPELPKPDKSILYPGISKKNGVWISKENAYMRSVDASKGYPIKFRSKFKNLYSVGSHNGKTKYDFTSMESAVTNGMVLCNELIDDRYDIKSQIDVSFIIKIIMLIVILYLINIYKNGRISL